jgi:hypothetical protein
MNAAKQIDPQPISKPDECQARVVGRSNANPAGLTVVTPSEPVACTRTVEMDLAELIHRHGLLSVIGCFDLERLCNNLRRYPAPDSDGNLQTIPERGNLDVSWSKKHIKRRPKGGS